MGIAPVVGVPLFALANLLVAWRLSETVRASRGPSYRAAREQRGVDPGRIHFEVF
jgi:hypothetical protein